MPGTFIISLFLTGILSAVCVTAVMAFPGADKTLRAGELPVVAFTQHPSPQSACEGSGISFSVVASGTGTLFYQWQVSTNGGGAWGNVTNGSTYANATTATLSVLVAAGSMNTYQYRCQVTDNSGPSFSNAAQLTVNPLPTVLASDGDKNLCALGGTTLSGTFNADYSYQWQVSTDGGTSWNNVSDGAVYTGAAAQILIISNGTGLDGYLYRYVAKNNITLCTATSARTTLHVFQPVFTLQPPATMTICAGSPVSFPVTATSPTTLTYDWQQSTGVLTALTDNATYSGTATNTLTIAAAATTTAMNGLKYAVYARDTYGCPTLSTIVTLNVYTSLVINTQPRDTFACANLPIGGAFRVTMVSGSGPLTYQWQTDNGTNGVTWSAANPAVGPTATTTSVLSLSTVTPAMNGYRYRVMITGACGTIFSNEATLRVLADGTWRGTTNTNWHTSTNWCGGVPTSTTDVLIPAWAPRMPEISNATITAYSRALHIEPNAKLTISGGTTVMSGPFNIEGTVAYTANGDQQVLPAAHGSLEINGSGNKYMQSQVDISHNLVLGGSAKLVTGTSLLVMKTGSNPISGATFNGAATSWIVTGNGGNGAANTGLGGLRIEQLDATDGNVLYPVGATPAAYNPLQLTNTGTVDHFTIAVNDQVIPGGVFQSGINRTWLVSEAVPGGSAISLALRWTGPEELSAFDRTRNELIRSDGAAIVQSSATDVATGAGPYSRSSGGYTVLTQFSVASYAKLLPLTLSAFNAQIINKNTVRLNWKSDSRSEGGAFVVQKSAEGHSFSDIGVVSQETGKTTYDFTDYRLGDGINRYRLKIAAPGLEAQYSKMLQIDNRSFNQYLELRPSVTNKELTTLYIALSVKDKLSVSVIDAAGRVQFIKSVQLEKGEHYLPLHIGHLTKGVYYVRVTGSYTINQSLHLVKQ
jgi:hypothetical protein